MEKKRPIGVIIIGIILILGSIIQLFNIPNPFSRYQVIHSSLSESTILIRYIISYSLRVVGLLSGVGILLLNNTVRKIAIALGCFTICTIYWRHPYYAFLIYTQDIYQKANIQMVSLSTFTWINVILRCCVDIAFALCIIYYLTQPKVKEQFRSSG